MVVWGGGAALSGEGRVIGRDGKVPKRGYIVQRLSVSGIIGSNGRVKKTIAKESGNEHTGKKTTMPVAKAGFRLNGP